MDEPAPVLGYDSLPPGSDVSISSGVDGLTIVVPPGEVRGEAKGAVRHGAMISAGVGCAILLLGGGVLLLLLGRPGRLPFMLLVTAAGAWAVFSLGLFLLMWRIMYVNQLDVLEEVRKQGTVIRVTGDRLRIETDGPLGAASHDLGRDRVRRVRAVRSGRPGEFEAHLPVWWLQVDLSDGRGLRICPGREEGELQRIGAAIRHVLG